MTDLADSCFHAFGLIAAAKSVEQAGVGAQQLGDGGMVAAVGFLEEGEGTLVERQGLFIASLRVIKCGQVVNHPADIGVTWPPGLLQNLQGHLEKPFSLPRLAFGH
jgi:hypothetical protein